MIPNAAPTLADVAARAGVSLATASRSLHPSNRVVRADLKSKVIAAALELGYSVNAQAQAVARGSGDTVVLVVGDIADPYFAGIAAGAMRIARSNGLVLTITALPLSANDSSDRQELEALNAIRAQRATSTRLALER